MSNQVEELKISPYIHSRRKRAFEFAIAGLLSIPAAPIIGVLGFINIFQVRAWPFFSNTIDLPDGRKASYWKLKTMFEGSQRLEHALAANQPARYLKKEGLDPRITPLGRLLRKTSLDELPQLFQVLMGGLALVGTKVPLNSEWENEIYPHKDDEPYKSYIRLLEQTERPIKAGLTGPYGVSGRSDLDVREHIAGDIEYIKTANLRDDVRIIFQTALAVLSRRGAY